MLNQLESKLIEFEPWPGVKMGAMSPELIPEAMTSGASCLDLYIREKCSIFTESATLVGTGLFLLEAETYIPVIVPGLPAMELVPELQIWPRSSSFKSDILVHMGTVDRDYRGEIMVLLRSLDGWSTLAAMSRVAQLKLSFIAKPSKMYSSMRTRGVGGFGSTGGGK